MEKDWSDFNLIADYHTHTTFSHGRGSVRDNVIYAESLGLRKIAITDHGPGHFIFGVSKKSLAKQFGEINQLRQEFPQIQILAGVEGNIKGLDGKIDIDEELQNSLDIVLCGFHKPVWASKISDYFTLFYNSYSKLIYKPTINQIERNTKAYINAIKKNKIDIITHINYHLRVDCSEVAKCCADYGTAIEISTRHSDCSEKDYENLFSSNAYFSVNSDAHKVENIAKCDKALNILKSYNVDAKKIINSDNCDFKFRSKN